MKKLISILLIFVVSASLSGCGYLRYEFSKDFNSSEIDAPNEGNTSNESADSIGSAEKFYDKVNESKVLLDLVATDVCAAWKDAAYDYDLTTEEVNNAIEKAKSKHSEDISKINEFDKEIRDLFDKAKKENKKYNVEIELKRVMTAYSEYKDSVLNANEALDSGGYMGVSLSKKSLDDALQDLFVEL